MKKIFILLFVAFLCSLSSLRAEDKGKPAAVSPSAGVAKPPINLAAWVIVPRNCRTCQPGPVIESLKSFFPELKPQIISPTEPLAANMIKEFKITMLPAYVFSKSIEQAANFEKFKQVVDLMDNKYYLKPSLSGVSYFLSRPLEPGKLDLFVFITAKETFPILKMVEGVVQQKQSSKKFALHLIGKENKEKSEFISPVGNREVEEGKLFSCIEAYAPQDSWKYLTCRMGDTDSLFWEDCFQSKSAKKEKIKECAKSNEGKRLYLEKIKLSQELQLLYGPLFLLNNVEIFGVTPQSTLNDILNAIGN